MIYLDTTTKKLQIVLVGAVTTNQLEVSSYYFDLIPQSTTTLRRGGTKVATSNNTTDVDIVDAPELQGRIRNVHTIMIHNKDTVTATITVKLDNSGTETILTKQTLRAQETLVYEDQAGWQVITPVTIAITSSADNPDLTFATSGTTVITLPTSGTMATLNSSETFTNNTLTSPTINDGTTNLDGGTLILPTSAGPSQTVEGSVVWDSDDNVLTIGDGASRQTFASTTGTATLTGKTIDLTDNTLTGTLAEFNTALSDDNFASLTGSETLTNKTLTSPTINDGTTNLDGGTLILPQETTPAQTAEGSVVWDTDNDLLTVGDGASRKTMVDTAGTQTLTSKTINLASNTLTGTLAEFNTALSDANFASIAGSETLTNKTLTSPTITTPTITDGTIDGATVGTTTPDTGKFTTLQATGVTTLASDTNLVQTDGNLTFGPNTAYSASLVVGTSGGPGAATAAVVVSNGNLHIDSGDSYTIYLNYTGGTGGVSFGSGATASVAWMGPDGDLWKGSADNTGDKYWHAGNDGSGSGLDADTVDGSAPGTIWTQNSNNVSITGGSITGITDLAVADGGTGASDASTARTNLGLVIGTNVQAYDAQLADIAALAVTDGNIIVGDGVNWVAESGATARTSLGLGTGNSPEFTAVNIGHASDTTITKVSAGVIAVEGSNVLLASGLGSITQAYDAQLADIAGLAVTDGNIIVGDGANWVAESGATARTSLGLTIGTNVQAYDAELAALAGLTSAADKLPYFTGSGTAALADFSTFARTIVDDADAATVRATIAAKAGPSTLEPARIIKTGATSLAQNTTTYGNTIGRAGTSETATAAFPMYPIAITTIYAESSAAIPASNSCVCTLRKNGADTALAATIAASTTQGSGTGSIEFGLGDYFAVKIVSSATAGTNDYKVTLLWEPLNEVDNDRSQLLWGTRGTSVACVGEPGTGSGATTQTQVPLPDCLIGAPFVFYTTLGSGVAATGYDDADGGGNVDIIFHRNGTGFPSTTANNHKAGLGGFQAAMPTMKYDSMDTLRVVSDLAQQAVTVPIRSQDATQYPPCPMFFYISAQTQNTTSYGGGYLADANLTVESDAQIAMPVACTVKNLRTSCDSAPAAGQTYTYTVKKNGVDTAITSQATSAGRQSYDLTNEVSFAAGDLLSIKSVASATAGTRYSCMTLEAFL